MLRTNTNFETYRLSSQKAPIWVVEFDGIGTYFSSGPFSGITSDYKKHLKSLQMTNPHADPLAFHTELGGVDFEIINKDNVIRGLMTNTFIGRKVIVKIGYQELAITDFTTFENMVITNFELLDDLMTYKFKARNKLITKKRIFACLGKTYLTADENGVDTTINVADTSTFQAAAAAPWGENSNTYIVIDNECMRYTAKTANTFTVVRHGFNTDPSTHAEGAEVREIMFFVDDSESNGLTLLLQVLVTGGNPVDLAAYDVGLDGWGLGLNEDFIDSNQMENELGHYGKWGGELGCDRYFLIDPKDGIEDGFEWLEKNILKLVPAYFIITDEGKLGLRAWDSFGAKEGLETLDENVLMKPSIELKSTSYMTHFELHGTYNPASNTYSTIREFELAEASALHGELDRLVLKFPTYQTQAQLANYVARLQERIFGRLAIPFVEIKLTGNMKTQLLQSGDLVNITNSKIPDLSDGFSTWSEEGSEVVKTSMNYHKGVIQNEIIAHCIETREMADFQDIHVFDEDDIAASGNTTITRSADHAENNLEAADGYIDQSIYSATNVMVTLELELPDAGGPPELGVYITVYIKCQSPINTDIKEIEKRIYYNFDKKGKQYTQLYCLGMAKTQFARIRVDWTSSSVEPIDEPTSVKLVRVKFWDWKGTVNTTDLKG
jgi:hypothetical protein